VMSGVGEKGEFIVAQIILSFFLRSPLSV
jgi:hypothetical protein